MPLKDIKAGMKGTCVTVVRGHEKVEFDVEILDVLQNISPKRNLILARFTGKVVELSGIARGMSGSPVYIDGKLIGALAYTWGYLKEAIGGIQPIEEMLPVLETQKKEDLQKPPLQFIPIDQKLAKDLKIDIPLTNLSYQNQNFKPLALPLSVSGFSSGVFDFFKEKFQKLGFEMIQGAGGAKASSNNEDNSLNPGDAVAISMVKGDANIAAVGTVTYREGEKVLIFGHPFMERGFMDMPLAKAFVHYVLPSLDVSWKFASAGKIIGVAYNDSETAVAGKLGQAPKMLPVQISFTHNQKKDTFNYEMITDPLFFPNLFAGVLMSSVFSQEAKKSEGSFLLEYRLKIKNTANQESKEIVLKDFFIGSNESALYETLFKTMQPIQFLMYNWFSEIQLEKITVDIKKIPQFQIALIDKAVILNQRIKKGENLNLRLYLRLYQGGYITKDISFPIPKNLTGNMAWVAVSSAKLENFTFMNQYPALFTPKNLDQLYDVLSKNSRFDQFATWLDVPQTGAIIDGHFLPNLPVSKMANYAFRERGNNFVNSRRNLQYIDTNYLIAGFLYVPVVVED